VGVDLTEVARRAGIRLETLSRIENGHAMPAAVTLGLILQAIGRGKPGMSRIHDLV